MSNKLIIEPKELKGEDGYKVISIRVKDENLKRLEVIIDKTNRSRNALINTFIEYCLDNCEIADRKGK